MQEIERKFLVTSNAFKDHARSQKRIVQGFLNTHPERTVRVRIKGEKGFITIKGKSNAAGTTRYEWEKEIGSQEAEALLTICEPGVITKIRYEVQVENHLFEVDEFFETNKGLIVAEVELDSEEEQFTKPSWLGKEVTGDVRYYNSQLAKNPFTNWQI